MCFKIIDQVLIIFIGKFLIPFVDSRNNSKIVLPISIHVSQNQQMKKVSFIPLRKIVSVFGFGQNNENDITSYFSYITVWWYSRVLISNECNMLHRQCIYIKRGMLLSDKNFCFPSHLFLTLSSSRYMSNAKLLSTIYIYIYIYVLYTDYVL